MSFEEDIHKLASDIAGQALKDSTALQDKLDALAKLTTYYGLYLKARGGDDDEPSTFAEVINRARSAVHPPSGGQDQDPAHGGPSRKIQARTGTG
jgi:hypothetical protein